MATSDRRTIPRGAAALAALALAAGAARGAVFDYRENVNVLSSHTSAVTARQGAGASNLIAHTDSLFDGGSITPGGPDNYLTIDFGTVRNVQRIRMMNWHGYQLTGAAVQTSTDGVSFGAPLSLSYSYSNPMGEIVLDVPVDTQYVRITGTGYNDANRRWIVKAMRVLGGAGTLDLLAPDVDLVSSTGLADGDANGATPTVTMTLNGTVNREGATLAEWVDDAYDPLKRQVIYNIDSGEGFTLAFDRVFEFTKLGFVSTNNDVNASWQVEVSLDGLDWGTPVYSQVGNPNGLKFVDLIPKEGQYVRLTYTQTQGTPHYNYINDVMVFGRLPQEQEAPIPEPASALMLSAALPLLLRRRRS